MISIIIPTLNEAALIGECIHSLRAEACDAEIIVADGGSTDNTRDIVSGIRGVRLVVSRRGRGPQMNSGAAVAAGDIFLFLHADTVLEPGWSHAILSALENNAVAGGAFTFAVRNRSWKYRLLEAWVRMRCVLCKLPYGDQGIFIKKDLFIHINGYREIPLMEDVDLIGRMGKIGRIAIAGKKAFTSDRRWAKKGFIRTAAKNQAIMLLYRLGVRPERLYQLYYR